MDSEIHVYPVNGTVTQLAVKQFWLRDVDKNGSKVITLKRHIILQRWVVCMCKMKRVLHMAIEIGAGILLSPPVIVIILFSNTKSKTSILIIFLKAPKTHTEYVTFFYSLNISQNI